MSQEKGLLFAIAGKRTCPKLPRFTPNRWKPARRLFELVAPDLAEMTTRRANLLKGGYPYLVAEEEGKILGYAYAGAYRPRPAYGATVENSIYIRSDLRGRGVGSALLAALIEAATARGFRQMIAVIGDSENHRLACASCPRRFRAYRHPALGRLETWALAR